MQQMFASLQRLPRGQLQRLQGLMQKAQQGQNVAREAAELERMLPPEFKAFAIALQNQWMGGGATPPEEALSEAQAEAVVMQAVKDGKMSVEQAKTLGVDAQAVAEAISSAQVDAPKKSGLFSKIIGKR